MIRVDTEATVPDTSMRSIRTVYDVGEPALRVVGSRLQHGPCAGCGDDAERLEHVPSPPLAESLGVLLGRCLRGGCRRRLGRRQETT
jgi:hypothetical protein